MFSPNQESEACILDYLDDNKYFSNPIELIKKYVELRKNKTNADLSDIEDLMSMSSAEDKLRIYHWLVKEKHQAVKQENYEYAAILRDAQNGLDGVIDVITASEEYRTAKEFLEENGIKGIDLKFEKHFLKRVEQIGEDYFNAMGFAVDVLPGEFVNSFGLIGEYLDSLKGKYFQR